MSKRSILATVLALTTLLVGGYLLAPTGSEAQQQPGTGQRSVFMRLKLQPVKDILEGIALEDFDRIAAQAERVHLLSLDESWMVIQTDEYRRQSDEFRRSVATITRAAKEKNIDGVTLGYMQMTLNCVRCHRQLRTPEAD
jgi:hypothetical protein